MWKDFKHHLVWELGDRWTLSILVGLQPASDPAAVASLLLVLPHRQDGVSSHLQREGEPVASTSVSPLCPYYLNLTFNICLPFSMLIRNLQGGKMESVTCKSPWSGTCVGPYAWPLILTQVHFYTVQVSKDDRSDIESSSDEEDGPPANQKHHSSATNGTNKNHGSNGYLTGGSYPDEHWSSCATGVTHLCVCVCMYVRGRNDSVK